MAINTSILKSYAPQARRDFIVAVKMRAARFGILDGTAAVIQEQGEVAIINGEAYPRAVARQCRDLEGKIVRRGFDAVMEEVAYTWFNRFAAIRYMELHGYLDHGFRVLSHPGGETTPEIVQQAEQVSLPGLKADRIVELKLDGRKDEELYRMLLVAQCNALHAAMPFLFERINDETELLLPDNLLHSDSLIREMVRRIPEADWQAIEIIGWLYQFYISEKKDQVIGKVVKSEDIPAATQLFTPNWIVKYMVQNSLGAKWLATYPDSPLKAKMEYYIEPAEQPEDVRRQIEAETPKSLDPETLTFLDPASGSGHILVEAYNLFKEIYLERGYRLRDIPRLILEKNIYGLDIDDRAAQLSGFALMMRARADDRRSLSNGEPVRLNVLSIQQSDGLNADEIIDALRSWSQRSDMAEGRGYPSEGLQVAEIRASDGKLLAEIIKAFANAKSFGSLITLPAHVTAGLSALRSKLPADGRGDLVDLSSEGHARTAIIPLVRQAEILSRKYDVVAANPPYMGSKAMNDRVRDFAQSAYPDSKSDLFAMFIERGFKWMAPHGLQAMVTMQSWMFLPSYEVLRSKLEEGASISAMVHMGNMVMGIAFGTAATVWKMGGGKEEKGAFCFVDHKDLGKNGSPVLFPPANERNCSAHAKGNLFRVSSEELDRIPGRPTAYWVTDRMRSTFERGENIEAIAPVRQGFQTGNNDKFLRQWFEVSLRDIGFEYTNTASFHKDGHKYAPYNKGGAYRRWYGNNDYVVAFNRQSYDELAQLGNKLPSRQLYFNESITWSSLSSGSFGARYNGVGFTFSAKGACAFPQDAFSMSATISILNSKVAERLLEFLSPTIDFNVGSIRQIPLMISSLEPSRDRIMQNAKQLIEIGRNDWNSFELSWDFQSFFLSFPADGNGKLEESYRAYRVASAAVLARMKALEEDNNRLFIEAYGLADELSSEVALEDITLRSNPNFLYGSKKLEAEAERLLLQDTVRDFISYAVGCIVGRFSPDKSGLILANQGENSKDFVEKVPHATFIPDEGNVLPILDDNWFENDVTDRLFEFIKLTFGAANFDGNLAFVEQALGKEVRKYFKRDFYSDHLRLYQRRPIYWLFSSGKEKAFEAIVYIHRYNEGTLARMRMNYVVPLQSQMASRIERLAAEANGVNLSSAERKRKDTQRAKLIKQLEELGRFEEELRHLADQRIRIDLDDGVKINYAKFGNLLAETKAVVGKDDD